MIPFIWNVQHTPKQKIDLWFPRGAMVVREWKLTANVYGFSLWSDKNILKIDGVGAALNGKGEVYCI